jgi:hypothetical protein
MNEYGIGSPTMPVGAEPSEEIVVTATEGYPARNTAGLATAEEAAATEAAATEAAPVLKEGILIDKRTGRELYLDLETDEYKDALTGEVVPGYQGMYRGGPVQAFRNGGNKGETRDAGYDYANALRTLAQGASFGTADEAEGYVSSLFSGRPYEDERDERRRLIERYALANPNTALALEGVGMIGGSMLAPSLGATRMMASAPRLARIAASGVDDLAQGIAYTAGKSNKMRDIPRDIRKDALGNAAAFGVATGVEQGGRAAGRRVAGKVAGTDRGYQAALMLKRLLSKY